MTAFTTDLIYNGEELKSIRILLETHWPDLAGLGWLEYLARQGNLKELLEEFTRMKDNQESAVDLGRSEHGAMTRGGDDQIARLIVDSDATPSDWEERVISRVEAE